MDAKKIHVSALGAGGSNEKKRFHVELKPGQTNIVSLKKLRREAGEVVSDDSSDENEAEKYIFVKLPRSKKRTDALAIRDKVQHNNGRIQHSEPSNDQTKRKRTELIDLIGEEDDVLLDNKSKKKGKKISSSFTSSAHLKFKEDKSTQHELYTRSSLSKNVEQEGFIKQKKGRNKLPSQNLPYTGHPLRTASVHLTGAPKSGDESLDQSIFQLKKLVKHSKTPLIDVQGPNASSLDIEKQLSPELKKKLAKVARSTQLIEGKISQELIDRLMDILGNYLKRKTLKKILREMILEDLYASKANYINFKQIKKDLVKMIRVQVPSLNVKVFPTSELSTGTYSMGDQMEDKLYDVYDKFIQAGLNKDIGPSLVRRFYAKLAELWPKDTMDRNEIREAIWRARERKMVLDSEEMLNTFTRKRE